MHPNKFLQGQLLSVFVSLAVTATASAITSTEFDGFDGGSLESWGVPLQGAVNTPDGGPAGVGDGFLQYTSTGVGGPGSRMVIPNADQWTGDYNAAGVTGISLDANNLSASETLALRLTVASVNFTADDAIYATTVPVRALPGTGWIEDIVFNLSADEMTLLSGTASLETVLSSVTEIRVLSSVGLPSIGNPGFPRGDNIAATIGLDNITAIAIPEPTAVASLFALLAPAIVLRRRRRQ